MKKMSMTNSRV